jgi:hypothetical protein
MLPPVAATPSWLVTLPVTVIGVTPPGSAMDGQPAEVCAVADGSTLTRLMRTHSASVACSTHTP